MTDTFACDVGLSACFAHVDGPEQLPFRVQGYSADGALVFDDYQPRDRARLSR
jgi:hypothetical protein